MCEEESFKLSVSGEKKERGKNKKTKQKEKKKKKKEAVLPARAEEDISAP